MKSLFLAAAAAAVMTFAMPMAADAKPMLKFTSACRIMTTSMARAIVTAKAMAGTSRWVITTLLFHSGRLSCGEARRIVRNNGYRNVDTIECNGRTYTFEATRRGRDVTVYVNSRNGRIWRG